MLTTLRTFLLRPLAPMSPGASVMLDLVRVIVAQIVVLTHCVDLLTDIAYPSDRFFAEWGAIAVVIFFVLSGYVISHSTLRRMQAGGGTYTFRDYFAERFVRIYTTLITGMVFLGCLAVLAWLIWQVPLSNVRLNDALGNLFMLVNHPVLIQLRKTVDASWIELFQFKYWGGSLPIWTLSIEWWMYMCFGLLLLGNHRKWYFWPLVLLTAISPAMELVYGSRLEPGLPFFWLLGIAAAVLSRARLPLTPATSAGIMIVSGAFIALAGAMVGWRICGAVFFLFLLATLSHYRDRSIAVSPGIIRAVRFMSGYSFMIYIVHFPVVQFFSYLKIPGGDAAHIALAFLASNAVSAGLAWPTEMRYKEIRTYVVNRFQRQAKLS